MEKIKHFFWLCSGAHIPLLKRANVESSKYAGIGATIFFTGIFAALAATYALLTVFDNPWIATILGLLWGGMIFNLDRYIVSSMRKEGRSWRELRTALPRIILAVIISLVIAKPLEMKIFEKEIRAELVIMEQQTYAAQENEIRLRFQGDQQQLQQDISYLKQEVAEKTRSRDELSRIAQAEADGTGGSMQRNAGPIYQLKKADADRVQRELDDLTRRNDSLIQVRLYSLSSRDDSLASAISSLGKQKLDGPASRIEALNRLTTKSNAVLWSHWFILMLFIAIETAPVFVKLISSRGPYDQLLYIEEHSFEGRRIEAVAHQHTALKRRAKDLPDTEKQFLEAQLDSWLE